jgi:hypothetical protein
LLYFGEGSRKRRTKGKKSKKEINEIRNREKQGEFWTGLQPSTVEEEN